MLRIVGLGLYSPWDLSLRGLSAVKKADSVYVELYTSFVEGGLEAVSRVCGRPVKELFRKDVEEGVDSLLSEAKNSNIVLLVAGDPLAATTHESIVLRAQATGVTVEIIHSSSIFSAVAETGLMAYNFGKTTTIPYPEKNYRPTSPYDAIKENKERGLHTLCLLDIKSEQARYMTVAEGIKQLLEMESEKKQGAFTGQTLCVGVARLGSPNKAIKAGPAEKILAADFGGPPHSLIIPGKLHYLEEEALKGYCV